MPVKKEVHRVEFGESGTGQVEKWDEDLYTRVLSLLIVH
jgi:hypothetical protein